ncbi:ABC transporter permease [Vagococcus sp.]|uniref:ABC transporter permease n=1 Tax=Vagococcus sp. TaxID=1933889 RepID=UPI003F9EA298
MVKNLLLSTLLSLRAHKLRVFLTMVGIIIGITAVVTVSAIGEGMKQSSLKMVESTDANMVRLIYKEDEDEMMDQSFEPFSFSTTDLKMLRHLKNVDNIAADYGFGYGNDESIFTNINYFEIGDGTPIVANNNKNDKVKYGRSFTTQDANQNKIILTYEAMKDLLKIKKPKDIIGRAIDIDGLKFMVIGVKEKVNYDELAFNSDGSFQFSIVPKKAFNELAKNKPINAIKLKVTQGTDRQSVVDEANNLLKEYHLDLTGSFEEDRTNEEIKRDIENMMNTVMLGLLFITAISLLVGGIGVMNIMYVSVSERKREIGIRRAIGAKPSNILLQFLLEAAFITLLGGIIGILLGWGAASLISLLTPMEAIVSPKMALISASVSAGIGLFFGVIPAINAAKLDPIKAIYQ